MALSKKPYKGTRDFFPVQKRTQNFLFEMMSEAAEAFGYEPYDGPMLEEVDLYYAKSGEELINEQIYSFEDRGERKVAIRPEMTPTVARMVAQVHKQEAKPIRWYSIPNLYRYERPQKGRLREHWQWNCDIFGAPENKGELEIIQVLIFFLESLGANDEHFEILINDRRFVDYYFNEVIKADKELTQRFYKIVDKSKKVPQEALEKMLDETSATNEQKKSLLEYIKMDSFESLPENESTKNFLLFYEKAKALGIDSYLKFDPAIVRGLDYYTGIVFEVFDKNPENRRAISGGGAYANLLQIFNESPLPGIGFGMGDVTLTDFLVTHNLMPDFNDVPTELLVTYQSQAAEDAALMVANDLRAFGMRVELHLEDVRPKKVFTLAEKKGIGSVIFIGEDELKNNEVQVKNLKTKEAKNIKSDILKEIIEVVRKDS